MNPFNKSTRNRDLLGGYDAMAGAMPFMDIFMFILGWFTVPTEVFLRRDFGERYLSRANFMAGFLILAIWTIFIGGMAEIFSVFTPGGKSVGSQSAGVVGEVMGGFSWGMFKIWFLYVVVSSLHFLRIWWRDRTGNIMYSLDPGKSWLEPLGGLIVRLLNYPLGMILSFFAGMVLPSSQRHKIDDALPVLDDPRAFTERFLEPFLVYALGVYLFFQGSGVMGYWFMFSSMALALYTNFRYDAERHQLLDVRDQIIESAVMGDLMKGESERMRIKQGARRIMQQIAEEVQEVATPAEIETIKQEQPTIAAAMAALSPKLRNMGVEKEKTEQHLESI